MTRRSFFQRTVGAMVAAVAARYAPKAPTPVTIEPYGPITWTTGCMSDGIYFFAHDGLYTINQDGTRRIGTPV